MIRSFYVLFVCSCSFCFLCFAGLCDAYHLATSIFVSYYVVFLYYVSVFVPRGVYSGVGISNFFVGYYSMDTTRFV